MITVQERRPKTVPNIAVTLRRLRRHSVDNTALADPERPVFVINGVPKEIGSFPESKEAAPEGGETAYVDTWALGPLRPGQEKTFRWTVTAVRAGPYKITYEVAGRPERQGQGRGASAAQTPRGLFTGTSSDKAPTAAGRR